MLFGSSVCVVWGGYLLERWGGIGWVVQRGGRLRGGGLANMYE